MIKEIKSTLNLGTHSITMAIWSVLLNVLWFLSFDFFFFFLFLIRLRLRKFALL